MISNDTDNYVMYVKHEKKFAVAKALFAGYSDWQELYNKEIEFQTFLSAHDLAPFLLEKRKMIQVAGRPFVTWISEDAGLPIEKEDIEAANDVIDRLWDVGVKIHDYVDPKMFVKGFDGKIRVTDFKNAEWVIAENEDTPKRQYLQWKDF